jgi:hypothetical protein
MKAFLTVAALVGWAGLRLRNDQSAWKIKGRKILHGNKYLRNYAYSMCMGGQQDTIIKISS